MITILNYIIGGDDESKYPFLPEVGKQMSGHNIQDFLNSDSPILENAKDRIIYGLKHGTSPEFNETIEMKTIAKFSFPIAMLLIKSTNQSYLISRFALAESRRVEEILHNENPDVIPQIFKTILNIQLSQSKDVKEESNITSEFLLKNRFKYKINLSDYLSRSISLPKIQWRLVNRSVSNGYVFLTQDELITLLREEIYQMIRSKIDELKIPPTLLEETALKSTIEQILKVAPRPPKAKVRVFSGEYPPCVTKAVEMIQKGDQVPHSGKFLMTTFLLRAGKTVDEIIDMYPTNLGFNQNITRYQVEHIAGLKGGGTKYDVPSCSTMKMKDFCYKTDACGTIKNPLQFTNKNPVKKNGRKNS
jgi:DNA primase large subunit|tara:strand:+ start:1611 stop:2693 length:1083 start_codon:yes stop_codon:yes gene_type:complete